MLVDAREPDVERDAAEAAAAAKRERTAAAEAREKERVAARVPAVARARGMLGLALIVLAVANVARVARPTDHERAPPTHAVNIGVAARVPTETASSTASVAPTGTPTASVAPTATPNDWSSLTAVALDIGLAGVSAGLRGAAAAFVPTEAASSTAIGDT